MYVKQSQYAIDNKRSSVTLVHKGNIMKFADGAFKSWGYEIAEKEFDVELLNWLMDETASRQKWYW